MEDGNCLKRKVPDDADGSHPAKRSSPSLDVPISGRDGFRSMSLTLRPRKPETRTTTTEPKIITDGSSETRHTTTQRGEVDPDSTTAINTTFHAVPDDSKDIDNCNCLVGGSMVEYPAVTRPDSKLLLQKLDGGHPFYGTNKDIQKFRDPIHAALDRRFGLKHGFHGVKLCQNRWTVALFGEPAKVENFVGRTIELDSEGQGLRLRLVKIGTPCTAFLCKGVPLGAKGVAHRSVLHGLLHLFEGQERLCVQVATSSNSGNSSSTDALLVTFTRPASFASFGFEVSLRQDGQRTLAFLPVDAAQATRCDICKTAGHTTTQCPNWTVLVLDTPSGPHPRTLTAVPQ